jgi:hypothetical protein
MRLKEWKLVAIGCSVAMIMLSAAFPVEAGGMRRKTCTEAAAVLSGVGGAPGWGRIQVEDLATAKKSTVREVEVDLFDMEPMAVFTIEADGVILGEVTTDASGWGSLRLGSRNNSRPRVPAELPAAGQLISASVRDRTQAFVLEGSFVKYADGGDDTTIYQEKISLDGVFGSGAAGVAWVEREADGTQEFHTRATGLMPGAIYTVLVDGFDAGMATADPIGQARLDLESPNDENPLPIDLQPVEDLRVVEWTDADSALVLAGVLTGVSNTNPDDGSNDGPSGDNTCPGDDHHCPGDDHTCPNGHDCPGYGDDDNTCPGDDHNCTDDDDHTCPNGHDCPGYGDDDDDDNDIGNCDNPNCRSCGGGW